MVEILKSIPLLEKSEINKELKDNMGGYLSDLRGEKTLLSIGEKTLKKEMIHRHVH